MFWNLTEDILKKNATFDNQNFVFDLIQTPTPGIPDGKYSIEKDNRDTMYFYRPSGLLGERVIQTGKETPTQPEELVFYPDKYHSNVSALQDYR